LNIVYGLTDTSYVKGYHVLQNGGIAILGMSPGNSYFKQHIIYDLINFTTNVFSKIYIIVPDQPSIHTYKSLGYNNHESTQRAYKYSRRLINHIDKNIIQTLQEKPNAFIYRFKWKTDIELSFCYQKQLKYVSEIYKSHTEFRNDAHNQVEQVIRHHTKEGPVITMENLEKGAQYVIEEIAFCLACPTLLETNNIALVYHKDWPLCNKFFSGYYTGVFYNIGFVLIS
jgi:hypothetical protein